MFKEHYGYQSPFAVAEDLLRADNNKNNQIENQATFPINKI